MRCCAYITTTPYVLSERNVPGIVINASALYKRSLVEYHVCVPSAVRLGRATNAVRLGRDTNTRTHHLYTCWHASFVGAQGGTTGRCLELLQFLFLQPSLPDSIPSAPSLFLCAQQSFHDATVLLVSGVPLGNDASTLERCEGFRLRPAPSDGESTVVSIRIARWARSKPPISASRTTSAALSTSKYHPSQCRQ